MYAIIYLPCLFPLFHLVNKKIWWNSYKKRRNRAGNRHNATALHATKAHVSTAPPSFSIPNCKLFIRMSIMTQRRKRVCVSVKWAWKGASPDGNDWPRPPRSPTFKGHANTFRSDLESNTSAAILQLSYIPFSGWKVRRRCLKNPQPFGD